MYCQDKIAENMRQCAGDIKLYRIRLLGHCIFCLRKTFKSGNGSQSVSSFSLNSIDQLELEIVPQAVISSSAAALKLLSSFNRIWPYLQQKQSNCPFGLPAFGESKSTADTNKSTLFSRLPKMCQFCADKLVAIDKLWRELVEQLHGLKSTSQETKIGGKFSYRAENFRKALMTSDKVETDSVFATLEFLEISECGALAETNLEPVNDQKQSEESSGNTSDLPLSPHIVPAKETPELPPLSSPLLIITDANDIIFSLTSTISFAAAVPSMHNNKQLVRQNSVQVVTSLESPAKIFQQSSDTSTSLENEISFDQEDAELADNESEPDYMKLEQEDEDDSVSDYDSTDEEEGSVAQLSFEHSSRVINKSLSNIFFGKVGVSVTVEI